MQVKELEALLEGERAAAAAKQAEMASLVRCCGCYRTRPGVPVCVTVTVAGSLCYPHLCLSADHYVTCALP